MSELGQKGASTIPVCLYYWVHPHEPLMAISTLPRVEP